MPGPHPPEFRRRAVELARLREKPPRRSPWTSASAIAARRCRQRVDQPAGQSALVVADVRQLLPGDLPGCPPIAC